MRYSAIAAPNLLGPELRPSGRKVDLSGPIGKASPDRGSGPRLDGAARALWFCLICQRSRATRCGRLRSGYLVGVALLNDTFLRDCAARGDRSLADGAFLDRGGAAARREDRHRDHQSEGACDHQDHADRVNVKPLVVTWTANVKIAPTAISNIPTPMRPWDLPNERAPAVVSGTRWSIVRTPLDPNGSGGHSPSAAEWRGGGYLRSMPFSCNASGTACGAMKSHGPA
jgi:hypothetical protein